MNEIVARNMQLPDDLKELSKFVLIGRDAVDKVKAEIRAIDKLKLSNEVRKQKLEEGQYLAELVLDAEVQIGKLTAAIPKATKGTGSNQYKKAEIDNNVEFSKPKSEALREIGIQQKQAERYERLAKHPEAVQLAKIKAKETDRIVTRQDVIKEIEKPHVANNSEDNEWYTPVEYLESARAVLGTINLDPASNDFANERVQAEMYYTEDDNGLNQEWYGNIWLNPPYSSDSVKPFVEKLVNSSFDEAIVLVNNATETEWFNILISKASAIVFPKGRIQFDKRDGKHGSPLQGQAFIYYGEREEMFLKEFLKYGWGSKLNNGIQQRK